MFVVSFRRRPSGRFNVDVTAGQSSHAQLNVAPPAIVVTIRVVALYRRSRWYPAGHDSVKNTSLREVTASPPTFKSVCALAGPSADGTDEPLPRIVPTVPFARDTVRMRRPPREPTKSVVGDSASANGWFNAVAHARPPSPWYEPEPVPRSVQMVPAPCALQLGKGSGVGPGVIVLVGVALCVRVSEGVELAVLDAVAPMNAPTM
jgi:hypothetical protein